MVLEMLLSVAGLIKRLPGVVIPLLKNIGKYYFSEHNGDSPPNLLLYLKMLKVQKLKNLNYVHVAAPEPPFHMGFWESHRANGIQLG